MKLKPPCDNLLQESRSLRRFETLSKHPLIGVHQNPRQCSTSLLSGSEVKPNQGNTDEAVFVALGQAGADPLPHSDIGLRLPSLVAGHTTPHVFLEPFAFVPTSGILAKTVVLGFESKVHVVHVSLFCSHNL